MNNQDNDLQLDKAILSTWYKATRATWGFPWTFNAHPNKNSFDAP